MAKRHQLPQWVIPFAFSILPLVNAGCTATPPSTATLGVVLDRMMAQVKEAEEKAIGGADLVLVQAGGEVALAVQNAKGAYASSLDKTMDAFSSADQQVINSLNSTVQQFTSGTYTSVSALEKQALGIVHALPFSKNFPQLFEYTPRYVVPPSSATSTVALNFQGDFHDLPRPEYHAKLAVSGRDFNSVTKSSSFTSFEIPSQSFAFAETELRANYLKLDVPYKSGFIFTKRSHTEFELPVTALPKSPGKVVITINTPTPGTVQKQVTSPEMKQESGDDDIKDGGEHADLAIHKWTPDSGWRIVPSSVTYQVTWSQGKQGVDQDWWFSRNISTQNEAVLIFSTEHHGAGTSGKVHFKIIFAEEQDITRNAATDHVVAIAWGENKVLTVPNGSTWTGSYTRFDGKVQQFSGAYNDEFLRVSQSGSVINILANPTK